MYFSRMFSYKILEHDKKGVKINQRRFCVGNEEFCLEGWNRGKAFPVAKQDGRNTEIHPFLPQIFMYYLMPLPPLALTYIHSVVLVLLLFFQLASFLRSSVPLP